MKILLPLAVLDIVHMEHDANKMKNMDVYVATVSNLLLMCKYNIIIMHNCTTANMS